MKYQWKLLLPFTVLFSVVVLETGCDLFSPEEYAKNLTPVDSFTVFHNFINAYNTLDYEKILLSLDSTNFLFIPDTTRGAEYQPWFFAEEDQLTFEMFYLFEQSRQIPPLFLQVDTTLFSASPDSVDLHANYLLITPLEGYDTLAGGFELKISKIGNYWYISEWKDVEGKPRYETREEGDSTVVDTIYPRETEKDWSDLKVYFRTEGFY